MSSLFLNKFGGEKILFIWWFLVLAVVAGGIAIGVFMFYSAPLDVREVEAGILSNKIYDCLNDNGYLRSDALFDGFNIYFECGINRDIFFEDGTPYYLSVEINDSDINLFYEYSRSEDLKKNCFIEKAIRTKDYPKCVISYENFLFLEDGKQKELIVSVVAVSNQKGRSLPLL